MIKKFTQIKNLGLFGNFSWDANMPEFKRFNVIYGWNGSGKTTLSELFAALNSGSNENFPNLKYKMLSDEGELDHTTPYPRNIRVFNEHYVTQNIDLDNCSATPIFILGKENKILAELIKQDEITLHGNAAIPGDLGKLEQLRRFQKDKSAKEKEIGLKFTEIARRISEKLSGKEARNYNKNNAETDFNKMGEKRLLSHEQLASVNRTLQQRELFTIENLSLFSLIGEIEQLLVDTEAILQKTVVVNVIPRLKQNTDISQWVETGLSLHENHNSTQCEFCGQSIPEERIQTLVKFFNDEDKRFKEELDLFSSRIDAIINSLNNVRFPDKNSIFPELQAEFDKNTQEYLDASTALEKSLIQTKMEIGDKKFQTNEYIHFNTVVDLKPYINSVNGIESNINSHNDKLMKFSQEKSAAFQKWKEHLLSEFFDDIKKLQKELNDLSKSIQFLENGDPTIPDCIGTKALAERISANKNKISQSGIACDKLNEGLSTFLGRNELAFETCKTGYILKRNGQLASKLSEGEKTAISFVYFTIHLKDQNFNPETDIVVVDDPISSLDSNSLFQAFSFLKNSVKSCKQVFIFTHNHDFLRHIIGWLRYEKENKTAYFMVKNYYDDNQRIARLERLDPLLKVYSSEYQYLFKLLYNYSNTSDGTIQYAYPYPNLARKVLDHFLFICYPDNANPYQKLKRVKFDENKKDAIYRFTNDQSHISDMGFNPSLASESVNVISNLLEMMHHVFPIHYETLEKCVKESG